MQRQTNLPDSIKKIMGNPYLKFMRDMFKNDVCTTQPLSLIQLPDEILLLILSFLTPEELILIALTCHSMHALCQDNSLWKPYVDEKPEKGLSYQQYYQSQFTFWKKQDRNQLFGLTTQHQLLNAKILLVGTISSDKSEILDHYINAVYPKKCFRVMGVNIENKLVHLENDRPLHLHYWDISSEALDARGYPRNPLLNSLYTANACAFIVSISMHDHSFDHTQRWIDHLQFVFEKSNPNIMISIMGHYNAQQPIHLNPERLKQFAQANHINLLYVVNQHDTEQVKQAFDAIHHALFKHYKLGFYEQPLKLAVGHTTKPAPRSSCQLM